jgi:purine nucleosidase
MGYQVDAAHYHGADGLGESGYPLSARQVEEEHAVNALIRMAEESPGEITLVAIGPLTNVALATLLDPTLPAKFAQLVVMGGAIRGAGNITPAAEFNVYCDPEAAAVVFGAWPGLKLVPWETAMTHPFSAKQVEVLFSVDSPRAHFFRRITRWVIGINEQIGRGKTLWAPDLLAVAVALEPEIAHSVETHNVQVEVAGKHTRGHTTVDWSDSTGRETNVTLVLKMDTERLWQMMQAAVS